MGILQFAKKKNAKLPKSAETLHICRLKSYDLDLDLDFDIFQNQNKVHTTKQINYTKTYQPLTIVSYLIGSWIRPKNKFFLSWAFSCVNLSQKLVEYEKYK